MSKKELQQEIINRACRAEAVDPIGEHLADTPAKPYTNSAAELAEMGRAQINKLQECVAHWEAKAEEQHYDEILAKVRAERGGHE